MLIKSLRHYGIRVKDIQESLAFYQELGFEIVTAEHETWQDKELFVVKMSLEGDCTDTFCDGMRTIELVQGDWENHVAMTVDKLTDGYVQRPSGHKVKFITAPEGTRIELVEEP